LRLANMTNVLGDGALNGTLSIQALAGGRVELGQVLAMDAGYDGIYGGYQRAIQVLADGTNSVVDLSSLGRFITLAPTTASSLEARNGGAILTGNLGQVIGAALTLKPGGTLPMAQLTNLVAGTLTVVGVAPSLVGLTSIDGSSLYVSGGGLLDLPSVRSCDEPELGQTTFTWQASGAGSVLRLANMTNVLGDGALNGTLSIQALAGGRVELGQVLAMDAGYDGIYGGYQRAIQVLADGTDSVIDLSSLSGFANPLSGSSIVAQNGGTVLFNDQAFLLANVAISIPPGNPVLPPTLVASPTLTLYGKAWHSYWVEKLDTSNPATGWQFVARVPLTNAFQTFAGAPPPNTAYRVWEFVADPPILDVFRAPGQQYYLILYGATSETYQLQSTPDLTPPSTWTPGTVVNMTNAFRILPPAPFGPPGTSQFFRAKEE
jgi:hypothetical protein